MQLSENQFEASISLVYNIGEMIFKNQ
ncbi:hypothetical protein [Acinetobacter vivianii]